MRTAILTVKTTNGDIDFFPTEDGPKGMELGKVYLMSRLNEPLSIGTFVNPMYCEEDIGMPLMARILKILNEKETLYTFTWVTVNDKDELTITVDCLFNTEPPVKMTYGLTEEQKRKLH